MDQTEPVQVLNIVEDFDKDGIEDHYDLDDDNDGFSDAEEIAYGSDPKNPNSVANSLEQNGSSILENQPISSIVGVFQATDPDVNPPYSSWMIMDLCNSLFSLDENGSLTTSVVFDFESNESNFSIRVRVRDAYIEENFEIYLLNDPTDDHHLS